MNSIVSSASCTSFTITSGSLYLFLIDEGVDDSDLTVELVEEKYNLATKELHTEEDLVIDTLNKIIKCQDSKQTAELNCRFNQLTEDLCDTHSKIIFYSTVLRDLKRKSRTKRKKKNNWLQNFFLRILKVFKQ